MGTGNTIEARLRIAADVAQAIVQLRELKREILATGKAGDQAGTGITGAGGDGSSQRQQATQDRSAATAAAAARKAERTAEIEAARARRASEREAADALRTQRAAERKAAAERLREDQEATRSVRANTNLQKQAYRQLPAQITDIATSLVSGQPAYLVAIQQGGQLRDSFGSLRAVGTALLSVFTPMRLAVGAIAASFASVAFAAAQGYLETDRLNKSLALTGNPQGTTVGRLDQKARELADSQRVSIGSVRETLEALVATGQQTSATLDATARAVTAYRRLTGVSAEEAVKLFDGQGQAVLAWAQKANQAYNFLSAKDLDYIRTLQSQAKFAEAVAFANDRLAATLENRSVPAIGLLETAWKGVLSVLSGVVDKLKAIGRPTTLEDQIGTARRRLAEMVKAEDTLARLQKRAPDYRGAIALERANLDALEQQVREERVARDKIADAQQEERDKALKDTTSYLNAKAGLTSAEAQKALAEQQAIYDREERALKLSLATGLADETAVAQQLAELDERRLRAQRELIQAQIEAEKSRKPDTAEGRIGRDAAIAQLEAQLTDLDSRIQGAGQSAQEALAKDAAKQAAEWERAWREAADKIRTYTQQNAATAAGRNADPATRARLEAEAQVAAQRRALQEQQDGLTLQLKTRIDLDPKQKADLQRQLDELTQQGGAALGETQRRGIFDSLATQLSEQTEALRQGEAEINAEVERGAITTEDAERAKLEARKAAIPQLERIRDLLAEIADPNNPGEQAKVRATRQTVRDVTDLSTELGKVARSSGISELTQGLTDIVTGAKSAGEALRSMALGFARTMLNVLNQRLAEKLVNSFIDAASKSSTGYSADQSILNAIFAGLFHTGGVVGRGMASMSRSIAPAALATMQVLHSGGLAGMGVKPNEQLALLQKGEEVLTADDPRHVNNWRGGAAVGAVNISVNVQAGDGGASDIDGQRFGRQAQAVIRALIADEMRPGGSLAGAGGR